MSAAAGERKASLAAAAVLGFVAFLPFLRSCLAGQAFFFRDLSRQFFPLRRFAIEGLLRGEVRYWNPLLNEGVPLSLPALSYPLDLLQLLLRDEAGFSLLLALHVPLGALAFFGLARGLGLTRTAAVGGGLAYALGGFYLSTLNFYVYLQAAAWAPLLALALLRAAHGRRCSMALAALLVGVSLSTTGAEIVAQAVVFGLVLAGPALTGRGALRVGGSLVLGTGLAAPTLVALRAAVAGSARANGFPTDVVLAQSLHPLTLVQVVVGNWHGDLGNLANRWWGSNFFPMGFPYVLSLYLGGALVALALVGLLHGREPARRVALLAALGLFVAVGRWSGLAPVVDALPFVHAFRHPSKAFFTVHLAAALLAALGLDRLARAEARRAWSTLTAAAFGLGGSLVLWPALPTLSPGFVRFFLAGFLPPGYDWPRRLAVGDAITADAALGGMLTIALAGVAFLALAGRLPAPRATLLLVAILGADLLRTGAGLNPTVTARFYTLSPEMTAVLEPLRGGGRVFACEPEASSAYFRARRLHPDAHDAWTFATARETLAPATNVGLGIATALSRDMTMLVPVNQVLDLGEVGPQAFPAVAARLRRAGVAHVACLEALDSPELTPRAVVAPASIAPLEIHVADLTGALPLRAVARDVKPAALAAEAEGLASQAGFQAAGGAAVEGGSAVAGARGVARVTRSAPDREELDVTSDKASFLLVRDAFAAGWRASVDGVATPIRRLDGRHRAIGIPAGHSHVVLSYAPPGLAAAIAVAAACLGLVAVSAARR